jgi:hypothetical protein
MNDLLYDRYECPFSRRWEKWVTMWYSWMISIPKKENPCLDETGISCSINQNDRNVWFLAGTFGNTVPIRRKCTIPLGRAILFPLLVKEDSFAEDSDLKTEPELVKRAKDATDKLLYMEATLDGERIEHPEKYRVQSEVFDLKFPDDNVYDVSSGITRSVCDGFWLFIKPLESGEHVLRFAGETALAEPFTRDRMKNTRAYAPIREHINSNLTFKLEVSYSLTISDTDAS